MAWASQMASKEPPANSDVSSSPRLVRSPEKRNGNSLSILVGKSHGHRSLAGYGSWGYKRVRHNLVSD